MPTGTLAAQAGQVLGAVIRRGMIAPSAASAWLTYMSCAMSGPRLGGVSPK
jgi:hypothetical protein